MTEETGILIYGKHLNAALFWSGLEKEKQEEIKKYLTILKEDSEDHKREFEYIKQKLLESQKNV